MIVSYFHLDTWLGEGGGEHGLSITALTVMFLLLSLLTATQDVAVDGWSLTMLRPANLGLAATCNSVGMQLGWLLGFVVFTTLGGELGEYYNVMFNIYPLLESMEYVTLAQFFLFWGLVYLVTTSCVAIFLRESDKSQGAAGCDTEEPGVGVVEAYRIELSTGRFCPYRGLILVENAYYLCFHNQGTFLLTKPSVSYI